MARGRRSGVRVVARYRRRKNPGDFMSIESMAGNYRGKRKSKKRTSKRRSMKARMAYLRSLRGKGKARKATRKIPRGGRWHRPRVKFAKGRFYHARRSRLFGSRPVVVNPRRRRRNGSRRLRLNPFNVKGMIKQLTSKSWLMQIASMGVGIAAGFTGKSLAEMAMTKMNLGKYIKYSGVGGIILGTLLVAMGKKKMLKEIGIVIAGVGVYDLVQQNLAPTVLPAIQGVNISGLIPGPKTAGVSGSYPVPYLPVSPVSAMSSNYPSVARAGYQGSYQAPDMVQEGFSGQENPYEGIDW